MKTFLSNRLGMWQRVLLLLRILAISPRTAMSSPHTPLVIPLDPRIKFSIGTEYDYHDGGLIIADGPFSILEEAGDCELDEPQGFAFDTRRGLVFIVDTNNQRVQVFSSDDGGSFVTKFGSRGTQPGEFTLPSGIAIAHGHGRILITDTNNNRVQSWSLQDRDDHCDEGGGGYRPDRIIVEDTKSHRSVILSSIELSFLSCAGHQGSSNDYELNNPRGVTIDNRRHRVIIADTLNHRLVALSLIDLSFLFTVGGKQGHRPGEFNLPSGAAIDHDRDRIIITDTDNHRVQVLSAIDGSFLFEFGSQGKQPGQFYSPQGVCIITQGRIIIADTFNSRMQAFTSEGHHISSFHCSYPCGVAFDSHRGLIAFSLRHQVHVIGANQWLPDTFMWRVDRYRHAPRSIRQAILTMTMIRSLE